jgi:hypothetical protein
MTSPYVTFPQQTQPEPRSSAWPVFRAILSVAAVLGFALAYVVAGFIAAVTWTGCFIECTGENHLAGGALAALAVALLAAGPALVALMYRSRGWLWVAGLAAAGGAVLLVLLVSTN